MIDAASFIDMALSLPDTISTPHFERIGFKVTGKRMFASFLEENNTANIFLSPGEQRVFCALDPVNIYPVPNKWGEKGATTFVLDRLEPELVQEALYSAYRDTLRTNK